MKVLQPKTDIIEQHSVLYSEAFLLKKVIVSQSNDNQISYKSPFQILHNI